jgi:hypothetical protein
MIDVFGYLEITIESQSRARVRLIAIYKFAIARLVSIEKSNHLSAECIKKKGAFNKRFMMLNMFSV